MGRLILNSFLYWLIIIPLAVLNGVFRERFLVPAVGIEKAGVLSVIILCVLILVVAIVVIPGIQNASPRNFIIMGALWFLLTVLFETIMGLVTGRSLKEIFSDYNVFSGNLWVLVVFFAGIAPLLAAKLRGKI